MPFWEFKVTLNRKTGVERDASTNTFHAEDNTNDEGDPLIFATRLVGLYNNVQSGGNSIAQFLGYQMNRSPFANKIDCYRIPAVGEPMGAPDNTLLWTLGPSNPDGWNVPDADAICVSYHSDYFGANEVLGGGPNPRARRRNRFYLGPLRDAPLVQPLNGDQPVIVSPYARGIITEACADLEAANDEAGWAWVAYSGTLRHGLPVVGGWIDQRVDTVKKRRVRDETKTFWQAQS